MAALIGCIGLYGHCQSARLASGLDHPAHWLVQFDDAIVMPLWVFPAASVVALLIALLTVAGVAFTAANAGPGKALRPFFRLHRHK